jgi:hypothetical protein
MTAEIEPRELVLRHAQFEQPIEQVDHVRFGWRRASRRPTHEACCRPSSWRQRPRRWRYGIGVSASLSSACASRDCRAAPCWPWQISMHGSIAIVALRAGRVEHACRASLKIRSSFVTRRSAWTSKRTSAAGLASCISTRPRPRGWSSTRKSWWSRLTRNRSARPGSLGLDRSATCQSPSPAPPGRRVRSERRASLIPVRAAGLGCERSVARSAGRR